MGGAYGSSIHIRVRTETERTFSAPGGTPGASLRAPVQIRVPPAGRIPSKPTDRPVNQPASQPIEQGT